MLEDEGKRILRPIMSKKYERPVYERATSAKKPEEKSYQILTPFAVRAIERAAIAEKKKQEEKKAEEEKKKK